MKFKTLTAITLAGVLSLGGLGGCEKSNQRLQDFADSAMLSQITRTIKEAHNYSTFRNFLDKKAYDQLDKYLEECFDESIEFLNLAGYITEDSEYVSETAKVTIKRKIEFTNRSYEFEIVKWHPPMALPEEEQTKD
ncbi:MAG: hypothetical protein KJ767_00185 [Nanoarchaeota archaeon]|nr:hypothetical protein [Nanoarchaeota archaeon]